MSKRGQTTRAATRREMELCVPWRALTVSADPGQHREGARLLKEALERKDDLVPLLAQEIAAAQMTGDSSRLRGFLEGMLSAVCGLRDAGVKVQFKSPEIQSLWEMGLYRMKSTLPWMGTDDGLEALHSFIHVAETCTRRSKIQFTGRW